MAHNTYKKLIRILIGTTVCLWFVNVANLMLNRPSWQVDRFVDVAREANFPTWFSSVLLLIASYLAYQCLCADQTKKHKVLLQLLALGFLAMSCDETAQIHEHLGFTLNTHIFHIANLHSVWVVVLGPFVLVIISIFILNIKKCFSGSVKAQKLLLSGVGVYIFGAFFCEATLNFLDPVKLDAFLPIERLLEEFGEMSGVILIISGLNEHYKFLYNKVKVNAAN